MAYAEKRGNLWRARWRGLSGILESKPGFKTRKAAENYGRDQEAAIRNHTYVDPRAGQLSLTDWVNQWYPALLIAERCAALSDRDTDFVMTIYVAYTGSRWSEAIGLSPECVHGDQAQIDWKLYELNGRFYRGRPKDGSMRPADLPPFLTQLLTDRLANAGGMKCTCRNTEQPWCPGAEYVFLGPARGPFRPSNYPRTSFPT